jgi:photosystem II stability/assembly factor-like uncharacterized protein
MKQLSSTLVCLFTIIYSLLSTQLHSQTGWINQYYNSNVKPIRKILFIDENTGWAISGGGCTFISCGGFFRTTNGGTNWTMLFYNSKSYNSFDFINSSTGWMVAAYFDDIMGRGRYYYKTTDSGLNWILKLQDTLSGTYNYICFINASTGWIAGSSNNQGLLMRSTNAGESWSNYAVPSVTSLSYLLFVNADVGWTIGSQNKILKSTNSGINWIEQVGPGINLNGIDFLDLNTGWIVGNDGIIIKTTNSGLYWLTQASGISNNLASVHFINADTGWCSGNGGKILFTYNGGSNWYQQVSNTTYDLKSIYFINKNIGWSAGGFNTITGTCAILKTTTGGLIPVKHLGEAVPLKYLLYQNYPNPFNPKTKIKFVIPALEKYAGLIRIVIYDVFGREISNLVNETKMKPGEYEAEWDASNYASGVYFCKLVTDSYSETRKMVLLK